MKRALPLVLLLAGIGGAHLAFVAGQPSPRLAGDELHYLRTAQQDQLRGDTLLLPGWLRFGHRPEWQSRWLAQLGGADVSDEARLRRAGVLQTALLLIVVALVHAQARELGLGAVAAWGAAGLVAGFPWLGFHVHALWPELWHAACLAAALLGALVHLRTRKTLPLFASGVAMGAALLAKGTLAPFVPLFAGFFVVVAWRDAEAGGRARAVAARLGFLLGIGLVIGPQLAANLQAGHGPRLAANRWWNLELGLTVPVAAVEPGVAGPDGHWLAEEAQTRRYAAAARNAPARERAARGRVLDHVAAEGLLPVAAAQVGKLFDLWWAPRSLLPARQASLEQALGARRRWGDAPPAWLAWLREPARWMWRGLWLGGLAGLGVVARRSRGWALLAGFAATFVVAGLAVPVKVRFLLPIVPVLALGCGVWIDRLVARLGARPA